MLDNLKPDNSPASVARREHFMFAAMAFMMGGASVYTVQRFTGGLIANLPEKSTTTVPEIETVTALGRIEPKGEVIQLSAPAIGDGSRVEHLLVKEGDKVKANQVVAILDSRDRLRAAFKEAREAVKVAQANLALIAAGAKQGDIEAQKANIARLVVEQNTQIKAHKAAINRLQVKQSTEIKAQQATINRLQAETVREIEAQRTAISRLEARLENSRLEYQRYQSLYSSGAIALYSIDNKLLTLQTAKEQLAESRANLKRIKASKQQQIAEAQANLERIKASRQQQIAEAQAAMEGIQAATEQQIKQGRAVLQSIAEVRPIDILVAQAEVNRAVATMSRAQAELKQAYVRSPQDGQIFEINTRPGERVSNEGIAEIGETSSMYAVVEVYQSDINKIRLGQQVEVLSDAISGKLKGIVDQIGLQVHKQNVVNGDSPKNIDSQIVEVHVRLDDESSEKTARFTNLQVKAVVEI